MRLNGNLVLNSGGQGEIRNAICERLASAPSFNASEAGRLYYNTTSNTYFINNGTAWVALSTGGDTSTLQTEVDAIETSIGTMVNGSGVFQASAFSGFNNVVAPTSLTNVLSQIDAAIEGVDTFGEMNDVAFGTLVDNDILQYDTGTSKWVNVAIGSASGVQAYDTDLVAVAGLSSTGIAVRTGAGTWTTRALSAPAAGFTISNSDGVGGSPTFVLANDLAALEGLASTGIAVRDNTDSWVQRTITGTAGNITVSNGSGVAGNPTLDLASVSQGVGGSFLKVTLDGFGRVTQNTAVVAGDITSLVDSTYVNVAGDSMNSAANITFSGGGEIIGLPTTPSVSTAAASKAYVDNLVSSSTTWRDPIECPSLVDIVGSEPGSPVDHTSFITSAGGIWTGSVTVTTGDIMEWTGSAWEKLGVVAAGTRFLVAVERGTLGAGAYAAGMRAKDLVEYVSGTVTLPTSWVKPHESNYQGIMFSSSKVGGSATGLTNDSTVYNMTVDVNGTPNAITVTGSAAQTFTTLMTEINADLTGATATVVDGHIHITGANATDVILIKNGTSTDLLTSLTDFTEIRGSNKGGTTVLTHNLGCYEYGHVYLYSTTGHDWTEIAGPGSIGAGVGLAYDGNILNISLGAGIQELPSDEVGIDLYQPTSGGIFLTTDGTTRSTATSAKLFLMLDGSTLSQGVSGLKVADNGITATQIATSAVGDGLAGGDGTALSVNVDNISIEIDTNTLRVKALGITNAMLEGSIANAKLVNSKITITGDTGTQDLDLGDSLDVVGGTGIDTTVSATDTLTIALNATIDDLSDVVITSVGNYHVLTYDGTNWVNNKIYYLYDGSSAISHAVTHNLGQRYCNVTVVDSNNHEVVIPQSITFDDTDNLTVTFNSALACKIVVMGLNSIIV